MLINLNCTIQTPDRFVFKDSTYDIYESYPIDSFFETNPELRPEPPSTGLWRGYIATFEVIDSCLCVKDIQTYDYEGNSLGKKKYTSIKNQIFPQKDSLFVMDFSGLLIISKEFMVTGFQENIENGTTCYILEFDKGRLTDQFEFINTEFESLKALQLSAFKKTTAYQKVKKELIEDFGYRRNYAEDLIEWKIFHITQEILFHFE
jgi:hypothetical protein